ncbi:MAG: acyltransferase [Bacteroidota bacterium]|nr:acyltransferase [Bacteroidota bacterium]
MGLFISRFLSQKLRFYTFISIVLLLLVHGYNLHETYLQPFTMVHEPLTFTSFFEYFMANGILRFRIPLLFIISGYIYALQDKIPQVKHLLKRARTLLIPYLIWSAIGLAITYAWQQFPLTAKAVFNAQLDQLGDNRTYDQIGFSGIVFRWLLTPISFQLWFILAIFLYDLLYPFIKWILARKAMIWFMLTFLCWIFEISFLVIDSRGLFFFSLGIWIQKTNFQLDQKPRWLSVYIAWVFFIGCSLIKSFMAFELEPGNAFIRICLTILHDTSVIAGILAVWYGGDFLVRFFMRQSWFRWSASFSFFIFGLHAPLVVYLTHLCFLLYPGFAYYRLLTYFLAPLITLGICIGLGALLRKKLPAFYSLCTGGRGF